MLKACLISCNGVGPCGVASPYNKSVGPALAGLNPIRMSTRNIKKEDVMMQRRATHAAIEMHSKTRRRSHTSPAHISLAKQPMNHRMSRAGSIFRGQLVQQIEEAAKQDSEGDDTTGTALGLIARLRSLGLASVEMEGDGNCQFRAIADQLFGSQSHHAFVRSLAVVSEALYTPGAAGSSGLRPLPEEANRRLTALLGELRPPPRPSRC